MNKIKKSHNNNHRFAQKKQNKKNHLNNDLDKEEDARDNGKDRKEKDHKKQDKENATVPEAIAKERRRDETGKNATIPPRRTEDDHTVDHAHETIRKNNADLVIAIIVSNMNRNSPLPGFDEQTKQKIRRHRRVVGAEVGTIFLSTLIFSKLVIFKNYYRFNAPIKLTLAYLYFATLEPLSMGAGYLVHKHLNLE